MPRESQEDKDVAKCRVGAGWWSDLQAALEARERAVIEALHRRKAGKHGE